MDDDLKSVEWLGSSLKDLRDMPDEVRNVFGFALYLAQTGEKHDGAKPLRGFHGAGVLEVVESYHTNAYRAVYTVRFEEAVYVLHAFKKKSTREIETPERDMRVVEIRYKEAQALHEELLRQRKQKP